MKMKKFIHFVAVLLCLILLFCGCGTGGGAQSQENGVLEYDLDSGEDLRLSVSLDLSNGCTVYVGDTKLDKTEFSVDGSTLCISPYSLLFLEQGQTYSVRVEADNKNQQFQVKMISASNFSFDDADVCFSYEAPEDVVKVADFGTQTVENIRLGARAYADPSLYSYDAQTKTLTLKKEMLMNLPGETNILVRLSGGKEFSFNLTNTLLAYTDFENPEEIALLTGNYGMFWDATIDQVQQAGGTNVGKVLLDNDFSQELDPTVTKNYHKSSWYGATATLEDGWLHLTSSEHLFVFGTHYFGAYGGLQFETGKTYTVSFDLKRGSEFSNNAFTLTLAEEVENQDPRFGDQLKQVVITAM